MHSSVPREKSTREITEIAILSDRNRLSEEQTEIKLATPGIQGETDSRYRGGRLPRLSTSKSYRELLIANSDLSLIFAQESRRKRAFPRQPEVGANRERELAIRQEIANVRAS